MRGNLAQQFEARYQSGGIRAGIAYLEDLKRELEGTTKDVNDLIKSAQNIAVEQGLAAFVEDSPKELAPTKDEFIRLFGQTVFDKFKRFSKPKRIFTWLV